MQIRVQETQQKKPERRQTMSFLFQMTTAESFFEGLRDSFTCVEPTVVGGALFGDSSCMPSF